ncbi:MoaD/ThiS family protein [Pannus brasiliensis CCIBt3594]|uniref:MoaD/ThiS family protein n=1 Tax=Pannus brasiliensis CCIBt3594 TaxID=1427578 RepID=A0AAW9QFA3_9CHRO
MNISFSGTLLRFVDYQKEISLEAETVEQALGRVTEQYPALRTSLYDADGNVRKVHRLFLNGEQLLGNEIERPLQENDSLQILTAIAGG